MPLLNIIDLAAAGLYLALFVVVQLMKVKEVQHTVLSLMALALFQWTLTAYFVYNETTLAAVEVLIPFSCIGMFFFAALHLHFVYRVCFRRPMPTWLLLSLYGTAAGFSVVNVFVPVALTARVAADGSVVLMQAFASPLHYLWAIFYSVTWIVPIGLYVRISRTALLRRERRRTKLLAWVSAVTMIVAASEYYLTPLLPGWDAPTQSPIFFSAVIAAMVYAIWRYGFLRVSPGLLTDRILDSIEDLVLLFGTEGELVYRNRKASVVLLSGVAPETAGARSGEALIAERMVRPLSAPAVAFSADHTLPERSLTIPLCYNDPGLPGCADERRTISVRMHAQPLVDRFGDPLGTLVTGTVLPQLRDMLGLYHLTPREAEVLEYLMAGWTIKDTATTLSITDRTVKAHISSIYEKTGATNRVELANLVGGVG